MPITTSIDEFCVRAGGLSETDILRQRDDEAMKLSEEQNERFMDEIEGLHTEIERLKSELDSHKKYRRMWEATESFRTAVTDYLKCEIEELIKGDQFSETGCIDIRLVDMTVQPCPFEYDMSGDTMSLINDCLKEIPDLSLCDGNPNAKYSIMKKKYLMTNVGEYDEDGWTGDSYYMVIPVVIDDNMGMVEMGLRIVYMGDDIQVIYEVEQGNEVENLPYYTSEDFEEKTRFGRLHPNDIVVVTELEFN